MHPFLPSPSQANSIKLGAFKYEPSFGFLPLPDRRFRQFDVRPVAFNEKVGYNVEVKIEHYDFKKEVEGFSWFNRPADHEFGNGLTILPKGNTDYWQRTHYGFRKDDGHAYLKRIQGDFSLVTETHFSFHAKYDQCGIFARIDAANWVKASVEYDDEGSNKLGSVVTTLGYSDWAMQDAANGVDSMFYRLSRRDADFLLEWSETGKEWNQMRMLHLHAAGEELEAGVYACSPVDAGFRATFSFIEIGPCVWNPAANP